MTRSEPTERYRHRTPAQSAEREPRSAGYVRNPRTPRIEQAVPGDVLQEDPWPG